MTESERRNLKPINESEESDAFVEKSMNDLSTEGYASTLYDRLAKMTKEIARNMKIKGEVIIDIIKTTSDNDTYRVNFDYFDDNKNYTKLPLGFPSSDITDEELADVGIYQNTIRLSIGTEHIDDIIADLIIGALKKIK